MSNSNNKDIRWEQRFSNYTKALLKLNEAIEYIKENSVENELNIKISDSADVLQKIIKEGLIQRFEYTYEMAWNVMKDYAYYQGNSEIAGSRDAIRFAFSSNLIENGELWMEMIKSRIKTSHTYDEKIANDIYFKIITEYHPIFLDFLKVMESKLHKD